MLDQRWLMRLLVSVLLLSSSADAAAWDFNVTTNGNTIVATLNGMNSTACCAGEAVDDPDWFPIHCGGPCDGRRMELSCNRVGPHVVYITAFNTATNAYEVKQKTVDVVDPPPFTCPEFELYTNNNRVLTHKYGPEEWPRAQTADGQLKVMFKPIRVLAGTTMHVKVFDPPDSSPYRTGAQANDNADSAAGLISPSPSSGGAVSVSFTVPEHGLVPLYLNTTRFAAGDNYVVKASADPALITSPTYFCGAGCRETATITAWKRVYLEKKRMFRSGLFIVRETLAGGRQLIVEIPANASWNDVALRPGDSIRLLHAPRFDGLDFPSGFHSEDAVVEAVERVQGNKRRRTLTLTTALSYSYGPDISRQDAISRGISDAVGSLAAGVFERNEDYLHAGFDAAFVEFHPIPQRLQEIPFIPIVRDSYRLPNKWFENTPVSVVTFARPGDPNVKHVLTGTGIPDERRATELGSREYGATGIEVTAAVQDPPPPNPNFSWTWVAAIEAATANHGLLGGLDPWIVNGENLVHELAHTFNVNSTVYFGTDYGHCSRLMAGRPATNCMMRSNEDPMFSKLDKGDGIVGFHWSSDSDSEYMTIRRAIEPLLTPRR